MFESFKKEWRKLCRSRPGRRFQSRYARRYPTRQQADPKRRVARLVLGAGLLAIGIVLVFIPGPAILFIGLCCGLIASESRHAARFLDRTELRLRALWSWASWKWDGLPIGARAWFAGLVLCGVSVGVYFSYRLIVR